MALPADNMRMSPSMRLCPRARLRRHRGTRPHTHNIHKHSYARVSPPTRLPPEATPRFCCMPAHMCARMYAQICMTGAATARKICMTGAATARKPILLPPWYKYGKIACCAHCTRHIAVVRAASFARDYVYRIQRMGNCLGAMRAPI
jgi:hypothetical protein